MSNEGVCRQLRTLSSKFGPCDYFVLVNEDGTGSGAGQTPYISVLKPLDGPMASLDLSCRAEAVSVIVSGGLSPLFQPVNDVVDTSVTDDVTLFKTIRALIDRQLTENIDDRHSKARFVCNPVMYSYNRFDDKLIIGTIRHWRNADWTCRQLLVNDPEQDEALAAVADYVRNKTNRPLIITGNPGDGKTTVMSRAAFQVRQWIAQQNGSPNVSSTIVLRLLTVADSAASVIADLAGHLSRRGDAHVRPRSVVQIGSTYGEQRGFVSRLLASGDFSSMVVIMLDGVEEMKSALDLVDWLPVRLATNVKVSR